MILDEAFITRTKARIEQAMLPAMEKLYLHDRDSFDDGFRPGLKYVEKVVSYYDYYATGISVLAGPAAAGDERAMTVIRKIHRNMIYYRREIFGHAVGDRDNWRTPLRRLIFHAALAYDKLRNVLTRQEKDWCRKFMAEEVDLAIEHCRNFLPGEKDLHLASVNNHTAIYMQGIYYAGKVFDRPDWVELTLDFARRYFD
ncbi:MAG: hypothetical protein J7M14_06630, partial [Planctomycetes bacterium]|nr:hypothetical protein [Planctomycetota bacterium]